MLVLGGYPDQTFKPDKLISREEVATLVVNLVTIIDKEESVLVYDEIEYAGIPSKNKLGTDQ